METQRMEQLYQEGATLVSQMIPEAWDRFYLYAEVSKESRKVFFYYYPEGDDSPVYSLDIEDKFEIDEDRFNELDDALYDCFTELCGTNSLETIRNRGRTSRSTWIERASSRSISNTSFCPKIMILRILCCGRIRPWAFELAAIMRTK